jgi:hypothetical protein
MLQPGKSRVPFPVRSLDFFNILVPSSCTVALGLTQTLEMSTRDLPGGEGGKRWPARKADNLTAICEQIV